MIPDIYILYHLVLPSTYKIKYMSEYISENIDEMFSFVKLNKNGLKRLKGLLMEPE